MTLGSYQELARLLDEGHERLVLKADGPVRSAAEALARGFGGCASFSLVFADAAARAGHAVRLVGCEYGPEAGNVGDSHVTVEVYIDGKWVLFDPSFNRYLPGTSTADLLRDPSRAGAIVCGPLDPAHEWGSRYFGERYLAATRKVWIANGPSGHARQVFSTVDFLAQVDRLDSCCFQHRNQPAVFVGGDWRRLLRGLVAAVRYRRAIHVCMGAALWARR